MVRFLFVFVFAVEDIKQQQVAQNHQKIMNTKYVFERVEVILIVLAWSGVGVEFAGALVACRLYVLCSALLQYCGIILFPFQRLAIIIIRQHYDTSILFCSVAAIILRINC